MRAHALAADRYAAEPRAGAHKDRVWIGVDMGTSGCRAIAIDEDARVCAQARRALDPPTQPSPGHCTQNPEHWWDTLLGVLGDLKQALGGRAPVGLCLDATSSTVLLTDREGAPLGSARLYNDRSAVDEAAQVARVAPSESAARGATSSLAKVLLLYREAQPTHDVLALHQADWLLGRLCGRLGFSDWNNALKLGYDAQRLGWPDWLQEILPSGVRLPAVQAPGTIMGTLAPAIASPLGWPTSTAIHAGTTDSTAAVLAAGARRPGDAVTSLGSTLVVKILCEQPIRDSASGVYSQRYGDAWLVGGASNSGSAVLRAFFSDAEIAALSQVIDPHRPSGLDYYPLLTPGERFPHPDPEFAPRLTPRPTQPSDFLQGLLEGIANIEAEGYRRLVELGAPRPRRILTLGGGAVNPTWTRIRARILDTEVTAATQTEAAYGVAQLALENRLGMG
ncbi:carbohydrate kinase [Thiocapsa imhoffii]|uniref:Carbohydrate kinase n=1 Tax=Thiocapsa imhoffii TaxID=382777 RepID=A0A9X0WJ05_9GAMM|nr:FGGY-family carbohydrate kinase [Thiocapsa imhoffii]MBK1645614.1 carbohydrate kinase [Thiocapsa imhoffii]